MRLPLVVHNALMIISILLTGVMAGFFFAFSYDIIFMLDELPATRYAEVMELININVRNGMFGVFFFGAVGVSAVTLLLMLPKYRSATFLLFLAGFIVYLAGTFLVTTQINLPLNAYIESWNIQMPPADWAEARQRWQDANFIRTWSSIAAFLLYLFALITSSTQPQSSVTATSRPAQA